MTIIVMEYENPDVAAVRRAGMLTAAPSKRTYSTESYSTRRDLDEQEAEEYRRSAVRRVGPRDKYSNNYANTSSLVPGGTSNTRASLAVDRIQAQVTNEIAILKHQNELLKNKLDAERRAETDRKLKLRQIERNAQARKNWEAMTEGTKSLDDVLASNFVQQFGDDMQDLSVHSVSHDDAEYDAAIARLLSEINTDPFGSMLDETPQLPEEDNVFKDLFTGGVIELKNESYNPNHTKAQHRDRILRSKDFQLWLEGEFNTPNSRQIDWFVDLKLKIEEKEWRANMAAERFEIDHKTGMIRHAALPEFRPGAKF